MSLTQIGSNARIGFRFNFLTQFCIVYGQAKCESFRLKANSALLFLADVIEANLKKLLFNV
jgi:hypothetical protein